MARLFIVLLDCIVHLLLSSTLSDNSCSVDRTDAIDAGDVVNPISHQKLLVEVSKTFIRCYCIENFLDEVIMPTRNLVEVFIDGYDSCLAILGNPKGIICLLVNH